MPDRETNAARALIDERAIRVDLTHAHPAHALMTEPRTYSLYSMMAMFAAGLGLGMLAGDFHWTVSLAGTVAFFALSVPVAWALGWVERRVR